MRFWLALLSYLGLRAQAPVSAHGQCDVAVGMAGAVATVAQEPGRAIVPDCLCVPVAVLPHTEWACRLRSSQLQQRLPCHM